MASTTTRALTSRRWELNQLGRLAPVAVAGAGASWAFADAIGGQYLDGDPVSAAIDVVRRAELARHEAS